MKKSRKMFASKKCLPCRKGDPILNEKAVFDMLELLNSWQLNDDKTEISHRFKFKNFDQTMNFINSLAKISETNDHHPDVCFGYDYCHVSYSTHAIKGLSDNDFICAAKVDERFTES